jgi:rubrerythrin/predicted Holliday junction resolvase-like endonuclease
MLSTSNPKVIEFYKKHPELSFEHTNLLFVEMLEKMVDDKVSTSMVSQLLERLKSMEDSLSRQDGTMSLKMLEMKDKYMEDMKVVLSNNVSEKFSPLLQSYNQQLLDKTTILFQNILPDKMKELQSLITEESKKTTPDLSQLEQRFLQTQKDIEHGFKHVAEISTQNQQSVTELLSKMNNSSYKGKISENMIYSILESLYPSANIEFVGTTKETGDFIVSRKNKPKVLIENKDYTRTVPTEEVNKFIRDIETQKCCGLFISNSGIAGKDNFEVQVHNGDVLVYVQFCNYDSDKIKMAIDIIDHFKEMLDNLNEDTDTDSISKDLIKDINDEYKVWVTNRSTMLKSIKDFHDTMKKQLDSMSIPSLEKYLSTRFTPVSSMMTCEHCGFPCKNKQSLSAHLRGCPKLKK